jgi:hypothetical protein
MHSLHASIYITRKVIEEDNRTHYTRRYLAHRTIVFGIKVSILVVMYLQVEDIRNIISAKY